ncbi:MAG: tetratricopeptide repeat protein [Halieaceae bacterium]|jgi:hypothetical protein|nr:tetratricopeptide repeat protein [Halieaceae bacterium]
MSLLLEALKKAALEKRNRAGEAAHEQAVPAGDDVTPEQAGETASPAVETGPVDTAPPKGGVKPAAAEYLSHREAKRTASHRITLPEDEGDPETPAVEPASTVANESSLPEEQQDAESTAVLDDAFDAALYSEADQAEPVEREPETLSTPFENLTLPESPPEQESDEAAASGEDLDLELHADNTDVGLAEDDLVLDLDEDEDEDDQGDELLQVESPRSRLAAQAEAIAKREAQRQALATLMQRTRQIDRESRRRGTLMYAALTLTALCSIGLYYFYLVRVEGMPLSVSLDENLASMAASDTAASAPEPIVQAEIAAAAPGQSAPAADTRVADGEQLAGDPEAMASAAAVTESLDAAPASNAEPVAQEPASPRLVIQRRQTPQQTTQQVKQAFAAYRSGDLVEAARLYDAVLAREPRQRDALLGAAAIATQQGRLHEALRLYRRRLADDSQDTYARAGMLSLAAQAAADPALKSELKMLLAANPEQAHLHFLLGALYAAEENWAAAQQAFFDARARERDNPDYAYNLAVALEHIRKPEQALLQYRDAVALADAANARFDVALARRRISQLEAAKL